MAKYVLAYKGGSMAQTEEERQASMAAWGTWLGALGAAVVDGGNPFGPARTVTAAEVTDGGAAQLTGYSILEADTLDGATEMARGCPVLKHGGSVEVYEVFPVM